MPTRIPCFPDPRVPCLSQVTEVFRKSHQVGECRFLTAPALFGHSIYPQRAGLSFFVRGRRTEHVLDADRACFWCGPGPPVVRAGHVLDADRACFWCGSGMLLVQNLVPGVGDTWCRMRKVWARSRCRGHFLMAATRPGMAASIWSAMVSNPDASPNQGSSSGVPGVTEGS